MLLGPIFTRFIEKSPISVMTRGLIEFALCPRQLDQLFLEHAEQQYTRELLFSSVADLMSLVVCGTHASIRAGYRAAPDQIAVSLTSVYNKLAGIETNVSAELVRHTAHQLEPVLRQLGGALPELLSGYRIRILDGNHLAATEHRLAETWGDSAAPLPGQALVVFDPALRLTVDVFPCEDGHTQERALLDQVLATVHEREVWIADRNFCTQKFLLGIARRLGFFIIREHKGLTWETAGKLRFQGRIQGARVREQRIRLVDEQGTAWTLRRVLLQLDEPTRDGDSELALLTNLPVEAADACQVGTLYRKRWTIETAFQELTEALTCEINTLCYPKAALFGFCVALAAYNVLGVVRGALRAVHGATKIQEEVSSYALADEIAGVYQGMMIAIPAEEWKVFAGLPVAKLVEELRRLASKVRLERFRRSVRGPKKPALKRNYNPKHPHVATARLLEERKKKQKHPG